MLVNKPPPLLAQIPANKGGGVINKRLIVKSQNMRNMIVWEAIAVHKEVDGKVNGSARLSPPQAEKIWGFRAYYSGFYVDFISFQVFKCAVFLLQNRITRHLKVKIFPPAAGSLSE